MLTACLISTLLICQTPNTKAERPAPKAKEQPAKAPQTPAYRVIDSSPERRPGRPMGVHGYVLIPSLTRKSPPDQIKSICLAIAKKEDYTAAAFYHTEEAHKANISASYSNAHPTAMQEGFLGALGGSLTDPKIDEGVWQSADELYPETKPAAKPKGKTSRKR